MDQRRPASVSRQLSPSYSPAPLTAATAVTDDRRHARSRNGSAATAASATLATDYYQCESRTNRNLCDWNTHKAEAGRQRSRRARRREAMGRRTVRPRNGAASLVDIEARYAACGARQGVWQAARSTTGLGHFRTAESRETWRTLHDRGAKSSSDRRKTCRVARLVQHQASESEIRKRRQR